MSDISYDSSPVPVRDDIAAEARNAIDRVASSTGIPVEEEKLAASADYTELLVRIRYSGT